jgi:hypothetical protein
MAANAPSGTTYVTSCPHCHKPFAAELIAGGTERHRGFKCPHCKLFVPASRAEDSPSVAIPQAEHPQVRMLSAEIPEVSLRSGD